MLQLPPAVTTVLVVLALLAGAWWAYPGQRRVAYSTSELGALSVLGTCLLLIAVTGPSWSPQEAANQASDVPSILGRLLGPIVTMAGPGYQRAAPLWFDGLTVLASVSLLALVLPRFRFRPSALDARLTVQNSTQEVEFGRSRVLATSIVGIVCLQSLMGGVLSEWSGVFVDRTDFGLRKPLQFLLLALAAAAATVASSAWHRKAPNPDAVSRLGESAYDRLLAVVILAAACGQAFLGLAQQSADGVLVFHALVGGAILPPLFLHLAVRGWLVYAEGPVRSLSLMLGGLVALQVGLGLLALLVPGTLRFGALTGLLDLTLINLHQWGALALIGFSSALVCWLFRAGSLVVRRPPNGA